MRGGARADHERGIADHQVEAAPGHRGDHVTAQQLPVLPVERGGGRGEAQRPLGHVGGGDPAGVGAQMQRLDAGAGAEVERGVHGRAHRGRDQRLGGAADAQHVLGVQRAPGARGGRHVGEHPPLVPVRLQVDPGTQAVAVPLHDAPGQCLVQRERGQRGGHRRLRLGLVADEHADQRGQPVPVLGGAQRGPVVVAGHRAGGLRAQAVGDPVGGEAGERQRGAQRVDPGGGEQHVVTVHVLILPRAPSGVARHPPNP